MALLSVDEAQTRVLACANVTETEWVAVGEAAGRTLAADLGARRTQPPLALSAMDGYAVRLAGIAIGVPYPVVGESAAGGGHDTPVGPGEAVRIFTGAPLPDGCDTVIIQEDAERDGASVRFTSLPPPGRNVRARGLDFTAGVVGLTAGTLLTAGAVGLAAAMNHGMVPVRRRPRVAILSTGDELVAPGSEPGDNQIIATNGLVLAEIVRQSGGEVIDLGLVGDDLDAIRARIRAGLAAGADVLCLSGGSSVGDHDLTRPALAAEGVELDFWKIAARPGKPVMFGRRGAVAAIGLPGNPVSSLVSALLYLAPLLRASLGRADVLPRLEGGRLATAMPANDFRRDFVRGRVEDGPDGPLVRPLGNQDSSLLSTLARAEVLIVRAENAPAAAAGERVAFIRL
jgi:molybdopterin molybdotransferase